MLPGETMLLTDNLTIYTLFSKGAVQKLDPSEFYLPAELPNDLSGRWAIVGTLPFSLSALIAHFAASVTPSTAAGLSPSAAT